MKLERFEAAPDFLGSAEAFLVAREAEHRLVIGISGVLRDHPAVYPEPPYLATVSDGSRVVLAAVRTPPFGLVLSHALDSEAIELVVDDLAVRDRGIPGVVGPPAVADAFVRLWSSQTGRAARLELAEQAFELTRVRPPKRAVPGRWRLALEADRRQLTEWLIAFQQEAIPNLPAVPDLDAAVDRWIRRAGRSMYLWTVDDRVVSMVGVSSPTPNGIGVGPVYTPPLERRHGYASALTAAASQDQLDRGRRFCFLFTDVANPTSNHIYRSIGYEPVGYVDQYIFVDPDSAVASGGELRPRAVTEPTG